MCIGWVKLHRGIKDSWLWESKTFNNFQAFSDLLMDASHKDRKYMVNGVLVDLKEGQLATSIKSLCDKWGWSNSKVKKFLNNLQKSEYITYKTTNKYTLIDINKYYEMFEKNIPNDIPNDSEENEDISHFDDSENNNIDEENVPNTQQKHIKNESETNQKHNKKISDTHQENIKSESETNQKHTNKNDNNIYNYNYNNYNNTKNENNENKEEKEEKEEKEPIKSTPLFPSSLHEAIYKNLANPAYDTWFFNAYIKSCDACIDIIVKEEFKINIINSRYKKQLEEIFKKPINIKLAGAEEDINKKAEDKGEE